MTYTLRELEERDLPAINKWRADPSLIATLGAPFRYINLDVDKKWFESYMAHRDSAIRCSIVEEESGKLVGLVSLTAIDRLNQSAQLHIMIGSEDCRGRGAGSFAVQEIVRHGFYDMNLRRIELEVLEDNQRAKHVYEKAGFVREGVKRQAIYKNGRFVDMVLYAVLRPE